MIQCHNQSILDLATKEFFDELSKREKKTTHEIEVYKYCPYCGKKLTEK